MPNRQLKNDKAKPTSDKTDDQIISDLIENRKRQMEALIKIMSSIDESGDETDQLSATKKRNKISGKKK